MNNRLIIERRLARLHATVSADTPRQRARSCSRRIWRHTLDEFCALRIVPDIAGRTGAGEDGARAELHAAMPPCGPFETHGIAP